MGREVGVDLGEVGEGGGEYDQKSQRINKNTISRKELFMILQFLSDYVVLTKSFLLILSFFQSKVSTIIIHIRFHKGQMIRCI